MPTECRLGQGRVEGGFVLFEAGFDFHAEQKDTVFALACRQAKVTAVTKDKGDRTPILSGDADGYYVQVEQPGDYSVTLSLSVPLSPRPGGGRGFEIDLPRAVVTTLDLALPPDARAVRINGKDAADAALTLQEHRQENPPGPVDKLLLAGPLGILDKLDLSWQGPAPTGAPSLRTARCRTTVRVEGGSMTTQADLVLHAEGEPPAEWTVIVPRGFEIKASPADQPRIKSLTKADDPAGVAWTVGLKAASADDLTLTATGPATTLAPGQRTPVGPFLVRGASRQSGAVLVSAAGSDARLIPHPHADLAQRDLTEEERKDPGLIFAYEYAVAPGQPWLDVEAGAAGGSLKTQTAYAFRLGPTGPNSALEWQVAATFTVSSSGQTPIDHLDVELPSGCQYVPAPPDPNVKPDDTNPQLLHVALGGSSAAPFRFSVNARYRADPVPRQAQKQPYGLPRLLPSSIREMQDGGVQIEATVPDDLELPPPVEAVSQDPHHFTARLPTTPANFDLSWQPYTPERVSSVIDLTFSGRRADVQHELHLHFPRGAGTQVTLKTPPILGTSLKVVGSGGALMDDPAPGAGTRILKLLGAGPEQVVTLQYSFPVTGPSTAVPFASVDQAKGGDERVRVWCDPGRLPLPPGGDWSELDLEANRNKHRLPVLVLGSARPDAPLTLAFRDPAAAPSVLVDRALYRARLDGGAWEIDVSYLLRQPAEDHLDVELPDAPSVIRLHATLDDLDVDPETVEQAEPDGRFRHFAHFRLGGDLFLRPVVLEMKYRLPQREALENTLTPPRLIGDTGQAPTRWRITLPADQVALAPEAGAAERWTIGLRGRLVRLPAPVVAVTNDELEEWFAGGDVPVARGDLTPPSLVCWQDAGQPLTVVFFPEWVWMVLCSVLLLFFGFLLFTLARRSYAGGRVAAVLFWLLVLPVAPAIAAAWAYRPTILYAVAFGCEPGVPVLVLFLLFQVVMLERYRRRIVFLPNFRRARPGSSLVRGAVPARPAGEPSTVDAPRPAGSSQQPA